MGILYEKRERVAYITINRPEARNAIQHVEKVIFKLDNRKG